MAEVARIRIADFKRHVSEVDVEVDVLQQAASAFPGTEAAEGGASFVAEKMEKRELQLI